MKGKWIDIEFSANGRPVLRKLQFSLWVLPLLGGFNWNIAVLRCKRLRPGKATRGKRG